MSKRAWVYISAVFLAALILSARSLPHQAPAPSTWVAFATLIGMATLAQLFKAEAPNHIVFYASPIFFFAGALLLPPFLTILLVTGPHLVEWIRERWRDSPHLRAWYLQPFNIAMYSIAALSARWLYQTIDLGTLSAFNPVPMVDGLLAALAYVLVNHVLLGVALHLGRGVPWQESGILDASSTLTDMVLACVGLVITTLWRLDPWLIVPALAPLALMYQALLVPQLKQEAYTDAKTGLANARHLSAQFSTELDRAKRFDRPLAVIMADLDFLRDVNNTYGHLAGDTVLAGVAQIIRNTIREYDIAGRFGGEEFAIIAPETDPTEAEALAERLRQAIAAAGFAVASSAQPIGVTMSLGVACFPHDATTTIDLLHAADIAVYEAKARGRNRLVCAADLPPALREAQTRAMPHPAFPSAAPAVSLPTAYDTSEPAVAAQAQSAAHGAAAARLRHQWLFVGGVMLGGVAVSLLGFLQSPPPQPGLIGILVALAGIAELLQVDLYGRGTVSVSVGLAFAAALLTGLPGITAVGAAIAVAHHLRRGRRHRHLHRAAFNWATHVLAGLAPVLLIDLPDLPLHASDILQLLLPAAMAALIYYIVETGFVATAMGLAGGTHPFTIWRAQYRWLLGHYLAICLLGLVLSVAYSALGLLGILVFTLPVFMMHYAQQQYILQTKENVRALQHLNHELSRAALTDGLTNLGNHRRFQEELSRELERAARQGESLILARLDIDDLRIINDRHGQRHGDRLLVQLAAVLLSGRTADRAFRLSGDDFALILPHTSTTDALASMERLRREAQRRLEGATVSVGLASSQAGECDADLLQEQAGAALAEAKRRGRDTVVLYDQVQDRIQVASSTKIHAMHQLLADRKVDIAFQPIWDLRRGELLAYEALARPSAGFGFNGPQEAFDVAEQLGRAHDLDAICRHAILAHAATLPPDTLLFMNVSPQTLDHDLLAGSTLHDAVLAAGLPVERVVLELTERSMARLAVVVREAKRLRTLGFKLALDDTGAGNAGLEMLSQLPVDFIKIDRNVVATAQTNVASRAVLAGIVAIAVEMNTYVIAEGIETPAMLNQLQRVSRADPQPAVHGAQGYLLGRPGPIVRDRGSTTPLSVIATWSKGLDVVGGDEPRHAVLVP
jgi:diguanylate cyclase (GGDEF)-like protein